MFVMSQGQKQKQAKNNNNKQTKPQTFYQNFDFPGVKVQSNYKVFTITSKHDLYNDILVSHGTLKHRI